VKQLDAYVQKVGGEKLVPVVVKQFNEAPAGEVFGGRPGAGYEDQGGHES
jgi:hypothetical protein